MSWKHHPVTQEIFAEYRRRLAGLMDEMWGNVYSGDSHAAAVRSGAVQVYKDVLDVDFYFEETR